jgi:glycosyltransferase involved in cell wall biosynthesis
MYKNKSHNRIVHIITGLVEGGAESLLYNLIIKDQNNTHVVISLEGLEKYGEKLRRNNVEVICMELKKGITSIFGMPALIKILKQLQPKIVHTWMYHANLYGGIASLLLGLQNTIWSIHHHKLDNKSKNKTKISFKLGALLSYNIPNKIICVSQLVSEYHILKLYSKKKIITIENGIDVNQFQPKFDLKHDLYQKYRKNKNFVIIGIAARYDHYKDYENLLNAIRLVKNKINNFVCIGVGVNVTINNPHLRRLIDHNKIRNYFIPLGSCDAISDFYNSLDIHVLSSKNESFGLVIAEAMACGIPCVSTNVGSAKNIIGETGWLCKPKSPELLSLIIIEAIKAKNINENEWNSRKEKCRKRIVKLYSLEKTLNEYKDAWY